MTLLNNKANLSVTFERNTRELEWPSDISLLDFLQESGIDAPYSCRDGVCSACMCTATEGEVRMEHNGVLSGDELAEGLILACQAFPVSQVIKVEYS